MSGRCAWLWFATGPDGRVCLHPRRRCFYFSVSIFFFLLHASSLAFVFAALSPKLFNFFPLRQAGPLLLQNLLLLYAASASSLPSLLSAVSIVYLLPEGIIVLPSSCSAFSVLLSCSRNVSLAETLLAFICFLNVLTPSVTPPGLALLGILVKHIAGDDAVRFFPPFISCMSLLAAAASWPAPYVSLSLVGPREIVAGV